ncbi:competence protein ComEC [Formivibrio citricus]|uniref:Competence protein ComEC n=1 Tax=Formivibrio citricus TaxID=83765 RepID=A0A1I5CMC0_9NEIS|nr:DNA internalization-related competence protein ComEC/Rec2 [Formivibrio citricus]SFN88042.1 competence protein ComEC [Formivibrio citricus]
MLLRYLILIASFVAGVCLLQRQPALPPSWPFLLAAAAGAALSWKIIRWRTPLFAVVLFCAGFGYADWCAQRRLAGWLPLELESRPVVVEGYVSDLPQATRHGTRFLFSPTKAEMPLPAKIQVNWYGPKDRVQAGERWRLTLRLKRPHGQINPGGFDLESWFLQQGIGATASVRTGDKLEGLAAAAWLARIRSALRDRVNAALPDAPYAGVIVALTVGDQGNIPQEQWRRYATTGVTHLISISGLHITMLAGLMAWLMNFCWRRIPFLAARFGAPRAALLAGVATALVYSALAGMAVPTQRTLLMLGTAAFCLWRARPAATGAIWACALAVVVLFDPFAVLSVGFWLSFLTVGVLLWVGGHRLGEGVKWHGWISAQWAATLGSAPILLVVFGQLPLVSPLANGFAIPLVSIGVTPLALAGLFDPTGILLYLAERLYAATDWLLIQCAAVPHSLWTVTPPPLWALAPAALGVILLLAPRGVPGRMLGGVFLLPLFVLRPEPLPEGTYRATVLDVGQGLSVLVETRNSALMFDTGLAPNGERVGMPALRAAGRGRLDELVLSHNDNDHVGSAEAVLMQFPVGRVVHSLPDDLPWLEAVREQRRCRAGEGWERDGVRFSLLWPPEGFMRKDKNSMSCVLLVDNGRHRLLIPADLGGRPEARLVANGLPQSDIVVAAHHGGKGSSSLAFVEAARPRYAVFSAGYRNRFGHPRPEILERYAAAGAITLRTDESGALVFDVGDEIGVKRWREARRRYWYAVP